MRKPTIVRIILPDIRLIFSGSRQIFRKGSASHYLFDYLGNSGTGNIQRIDNVLKGLGDKIIRLSDKLDNYNQKLTDAQVMLKKPFAQEQDLKDKTIRLDELRSSFLKTFQHLS